MLKIGHRGAAGHAPENTLNAIEKGISLGVDLVEVDLQATRDGQLIIMHDKRVDRTTNGQGYIAEMDFDEIRKLDAGSGEKVPTLEEVLDCARGRIGLMLEIISMGIIQQVVACVRNSNFHDPVIYASFLHSEVKMVREMDKAAKSLALLEGIPIEPTRFAIDAGVSHVGLSIDSLTSKFIEKLHSNAFEVFIYTVNDLRDVRWVKSLGVDGIISDFPERIYP